MLGEKLQSGSHGHPSDVLGLFRLDANHHLWKGLAGGSIEARARSYFKVSELRSDPIGQIEANLKA